MEKEMFINSRFKTKKLFVSLMLALSVPALAAEDSVTELHTMTVIGDEEAARKLPGSASVVSSEQIKTEATTDINQVLKTVPGVYIQEEDGLGLRPNIGIRAAGADRSQYITLMEDGVLIAPAPYSNPAAYYFPTMLRMHSVEVLKGAPLLRYGPQTVGGVVNLLSTPIPDYNQGSAMFTMSNRGSTDLLLNYGGKEGQFGYLIETVQRNNEGFKNIDRSSQDSGFDIEDYVAKLSWEDERNFVLLKLQRSFENSNETYTGLTDVDFRRDENRRYGLTEIDNMENDHSGINLSHSFKWTDNLSSTLTLYKNEFKRDWFKGDNAEDYVNDANGGDANAQAVLDGDADATGLEFKHNNREYESRGAQLNFNWLTGNHDINLGARLHRDEMDRYQPVELYDQVNGELVYQGYKPGEISGSNNRLEEAKAFSAWFTDSIQATDRLLVNLSLRMEDVETQRRQFSTSDRSVEDATGYRSNEYREYLPGIAMTYDLTENLHVLAGYHEGMTPLGGGSADGEQPEKSDNYELGLRFNNGKFYSEAIAFYSDFSNKAELCSVAAPCSNGQTAGTLVIGGAEVKGVEFQLGTSFTTGDFYIPVDLMYTYTDAETTSEGGAIAGQKLQAVPSNIASLRVGLEHISGWNNYAVVKYIDETCSVIGCNQTSSRYDETDALTTVDLISRYQIDAGPELFVRVVNAFNRQEIISRNPYGARPNIERTVWAGLVHKF
jgi:Fe(3+) dicitrate transport protein